MNRRQFLATGLLGATVTPASRRAAAARPTTEPPGIVARRDYDLWCSGTAPAHDGDRVLVGRKGDRPDAEDPVDVVVLQNGDVLRRASFTPDLPKESHATPDVVRTAAGYAVAAGPWLARLETDLSVRSIAKNLDVEANKQTRLLALQDGFVVGFTEWLPNAFWTHLLGFGPEGAFRWYQEYDVNGSQALDFLVPGPDGGALAGGTFPWLAEVGTDGTFHDVALPTELEEDTLSGVLNAGVRDGDGLVLCSGSELVRLDAAFELDWHRRYDALTDEYVVDLLRTADGAFVFSSVGTVENGIRLSKTGPDGTLRWTHGYRLHNEADLPPQVLAEPEAGAYLLAGGNRLARKGWVVRFSEMATPTATPTEMVVTYSTETPTERPETTARTIVNSPPPSTTTSVPGFGPAAGVLSVGGAALLHALRGRDGG
jgi:hypothetical protein